MEPAERDARIGSVIDGRYRILESMAEGSMGVVYRGERIPVGKAVAIKFLHAAFASDPEFLGRFERETRVMSKLAHPHCVSVVDFGVAEGGAPYLVMDFVAGTTLRDLLDEGPLPLPRAFGLMRQLLAGLAHAHEQGIVHRDIKPANLMITEEIGTGEHVRILDFGLARLRGSISAHATQSYVVVGTPNYMAPEQTVGGSVDARADLYAAGVVLFEMITGDRPFAAEDTLDLLAMHRGAPVPRLSNRVSTEVALPRGLQGLVDKAMAKDRDARFQTAIEMAAALDAVADELEVNGGRRRTSGGFGDPMGSQPGLPLPTAATVPLQAIMPPEPPEPPEPPVPPTRRVRRITEEPARGGGFGRFLLLLTLLGGAGAAAWYMRSPSGGHAKVASGGSAGTGTGSAGSAAGSGSSVDGSDGSNAAVGSADGSSGSGSAAAADGSAAGSAGADVTDAGPAVAFWTPPDGGAPDPAAAGDDGGTAAEAADAGTIPFVDDQDDEPTDPAAAEDPDPGAAAAAADDADEAEDAPKTAAAAAARTPTPTHLASSVHEAVQMIKAGKRDLALSSLRVLEKKNPHSAYIPFLMGNLYFDKRWWSVAMDHYRKAIRTNSAYRANSTLNRNVIRMLGSAKTRGKAVYFLRKTIGHRSRPYLKSAATHDPNALVRKHAASLLRVIH